MDNNQPTESANDKVYWPYISYAIGTCTLLIIIFGIAAKSLSVIATELLIGFAALSVGFLVGFLFGLPRAGMQSSAGETSSEGDNSKSKGFANKVTYRPSTNLEQISDWLTKILIGVGLVELGQIKVLLAEMGRVIGKLTPDFAGNEVLPQIVLVAFSMIGFFIGYIWTRIEYAKLQVGADKSIWALLQSVTQVTELLANGKVISPNTDNSKGGNTSAVDDKVAAANNSDSGAASGNSPVPEDANIIQDTPAQDIENRNLEENRLTIRNEETHRDIKHDLIESNSSRYPLRMSEVLDWPSTAIIKLRMFNNASINDYNAIDKIFGDYPRAINNRRLNVKIESIIGKTILFSATALQYSGWEEGDAWFLINPDFGSNRIKRIPIVRGEAVVTFSTSKLFTIAVIMDKGSTILTYDLSRTPNLPGFLK